MKVILNKLCAVKEGWDDFWRREDEKYYADPVAYRRRMDRNFARIPMFFIACMLVWVSWEVLK